MNDKYVARAKVKVPDPRILTVMISKRCRQLANGARPMVRTNDENLVDIALLEIAEGALTFSHDPVAEDEPLTSIFGD